jgi:membrane protein YqaA with SNARE-associated domain
VIIERLKQKRWLRLILYLIVLIALSFGLAYVLGHLMAYLNLPLETLATTAYLVVFIVTLASNAAVFVPVALHISIILAAADKWNPAIIALVASVGGTLGEITAYYAGYLGKRVMHLENTPGYNRLASWMKRYGPWGIFFISLQPILPVDIAGLLAGVSKLPLWKFLLPCWPGKIIKYLLLCYLGTAVLRLLPPLPF